MTEITILLAAIDLNPAYMAQMDWREETDWFKKERMKQFIMGIENDECRKQAYWSGRSHQNIAIGKTFQSSYS